MGKSFFLTATLQPPILKWIWAASWQNQRNGMCAQWRLRSAWASAQSDLVFAVRMKKAWVLSYLLNAQRRLSSDWADAQADRSLCWAHSHFVSFVMRWLICTIPVHHNTIPITRALFYPWIFDECFCHLRDVLFISFLFTKILEVNANSVDPDQTLSLCVWVFHSPAVEDIYSHLQTQLIPARTRIHMKMLQTEDHKYLGHMSTVSPTVRHSRAYNHVVISAASPQCHHVPLTF